MQVDPPKADPLETMLEDISRTLQENQKFLKALQDDRLADDDLDGDADQTEAVEEFEEL